MLTAEFRVTNLGPGSGRAQVMAAAAWPDGRRTPLMLNGRPRGEWSSSTSTEGFTINVARHVLAVEGDRSRLTLRTSSSAFDLAAAAVAPAYRAARMSQGRAGFYDVIVFAPRMSVRGAAILPDGTRQDLGEGVGIGLHTLTNLADYDRAIAVLRLHTFEGASQVSFMEFTSARDEERVGLVLSIRGTRVVGSSGAFSRSYAGLRAEADKPRYPVPAGVEWSASNAAIRGRASLTLRRRDDLLAHVASPISRFIVGRTAHPVRYVFVADCRLMVDAEGEWLESNGAGVATLEILNPPPTVGLW